MRVPSQFISGAAAREVSQNARFWPGQSVFPGTIPSLETGFPARADPVPRPQRTVRSGGDGLNIVARLKSQRLDPAGKVNGNGLQCQMIRFREFVRGNAAVAPPG